MNISLTQLKALKAISQHESITNAAKSMNMTQPAVSIQLKNLQEQFEVPLTEIIGKKIYITEFGQELVEMADRIFADVNRIEQKMLELKGLLAGKIRISAVSTGKYIIPYLMADFMKINPHVEINLEVSNRNQVLAHLEENTTDLALISVNLPNEEKFDSITLEENKWYLACAPELEEKFREEINANNWEKIPFILREKGSGTRSKMEDFFKSRNINAESKLELATNEAVKQAIMAGLGASILSNFSMSQEIADNRITILQYPGLPLKSAWKLIWLKQKRHSPAVMAFIKWISENKKEIFTSNFNTFQD
jgi:DNA-binding transcriptional LysR family regulator